MWKLGRIIFSISSLLLQTSSNVNIIHWAKIKMSCDTIQATRHIFKFILIKLSNFWDNLIIIFKYPASWISDDNDDDVMRWRGYPFVTTSSVVIIHECFDKILSNKKNVWKAFEMKKKSELDMSEAESLIRNDISVITSVFARSPFRWLFNRLIIVVLQGPFTLTRNVNVIIRCWIKCSLHWLALANNGIVN